MSSIRFRMMGCKCPAGNCVTIMRLQSLIRDGCRGGLLLTATASGSGCLSTAAQFLHYKKQPSARRPSEIWWLVVFILAKVLKETNFVVQRLQGLLTIVRTLLSVQNEELQSLATPSQTET